MRAPIALGKLFDIEIRADFSRFIALAALIWSLRAGYFRAQYPSMSGLDTWSLALAAGACCGP